MVICLEQGADCFHMVQLMPLHPKTKLSDFTFLVPAYPSCPVKEAVKRVEQCPALGNIENHC